MPTPQALRSFSWNRLGTALAVGYLNKYGHAPPPLWDAAMDAALSDAISNIIKRGANPMSELNKAADKAHTELQTLLS